MESNVPDEHTGYCCRSYAMRLRIITKGPSILTNGVATAQEGQTDERLAVSKIFHEGSIQKRERLERRGPIEVSLNQERTSDVIHPVFHLKTPENAHHHSVVIFRGEAAFETQDRM